MRIFVMMSLPFLLATGVAAQERQEPSQPQTTVPAQTVASGGTANAAETFRSALGSLQLPVTAFVTTAAQQPPAPAAPRAPARPTTARRRGSMVGYIDDAIVESEVRVRFDAAWHNTVPDRAEFFYAKCGCYRDLAVLDPAAHDPDAPGPGPGIVTDLNFQQLDVWGEYAFSQFLSVFVQLPVRWLKPQSVNLAVVPAGETHFGDESGFGDMRAGVKGGFSPAVNHTLTTQAQFFLPTGDALKGLGTDHFSIEPGVLYNWQATDAVTVEAQLKVWLPFGGSAGVPTSIDDDFSGQVLTYGIGSGVNLFRRNDIEAGPVVELVGWRVLSGFQTATPADASGTSIVNVKIGGRVTLDATHSVYVGWGKALTDAVWYDDIWRFEYRFSF